MDISSHPHSIEQFYEVMAAAGTTREGVRQSIAELKARKEEQAAAIEAEWANDPFDAPMDVIHMWASLKDIQQV
jgi:hypothetical protein